MTFNEGESSVSDGPLPKARNERESAIHELGGALKGQRNALVGSILLKLAGQRQKLKIPRCVGIRLDLLPSSFEWVRSSDRVLGYCLNPA